jgi:hypothetical protein
MLERGEVRREDSGQKEINYQKEMILTDQTCQQSFQRKDSQRIRLRRQG